MEQPAKAIPVQWEAVRALAMVVGVREAARRMGVSEAAAMQQSNRKGWLASPEARRANQLAVAERTGGRGVPAAPVSQQMSAGAQISAEIAALGSKSRLSLARTIAKAGTHLETLNGAAVVADAGNVKAIAQTADLVHGWKDAAPQVKIRLDVLNGSTEAAPIDVTADVTLEMAEDCVDPLDEY